MATKPLRCRFGFHAYVRRHPPGERAEGPDHQVCRSCGRQRHLTTEGVPPGFVGG
ncbi:hypothetical protein ACI784_13425 [Geodermatophilus sp. SYSU D01186]